MPEGSPLSLPHPTLSSVHTLRTIEPSFTGSPWELWISSAETKHHQSFLLPSLQQPFPRVLSEPSSVSSQDGRDHRRELCPSDRACAKATFAEYSRLLLLFRLSLVLTKVFRGPSALRFLALKFILGPRQGVSKLFAMTKCRQQNVLMGSSG